MVFFRKKPTIKIQTTKKDTFSGWLKCMHCNEMVHKNELKVNLQCCPKCDHHHKMSVAERLDLLSDSQSFRELFTHLHSTDPLSFVDTKSYSQRLDEARKRSSTHEGVLTGVCTIEGYPMALAIMDFEFMAGSLGSVVGEKLTRLIEHATASQLPLVIVTASGGARMQESTLSLMQMAKTSAALARHHRAALPYISILTDPTSGGVTASFAALGDVIIAEPKALICFTGPRVIEQSLKRKLPDGVQRAEFLLEKGMVDFVSTRQEIKGTLAYVLDSLHYAPRSFKREEHAEDNLKRLMAYKKLSPLKEGT
ncbi:MAG: acetyl-CoA carboxylase carboxyltransferase subunit beta [Chlamydiia bacterium]|nr:acetyl-CoA carboxylase carboxyltransferase subunit beta [Chlamydiia bacterium]